MLSQQDIFYNREKHQNYISAFLLSLPIEYFSCIFRIPSHLICIICSGFAIGILLKPSKKMCFIETLSDYSTSF